MSLAALELFELTHGELRRGVRRRAYRESDEHLVRVQARIVVSEVVYLEILNRLYNAWGYEMYTVVYIAERLERV